MKKILSILSLLLFFMVACSDSDSDEGTTDNDTLIIDKSELTKRVYADETKAFITFTAKDSWTATINEVEDIKDLPGWIQVSESEGKANTDIIIEITLTPNYTGTSRQAVITLSSCNGKDTEDITIKQEATSKNGNKPQKRITQIESETSSNTIDFQYDSNNLIYGMSRPYNTFSYSVYRANDGTVLLKREGVVTAINTLTLNDKGYLASMDTENGIVYYMYNDEGYLVRTNHEVDGIIIGFDDKLSSFEEYEWTNGNMTKINYYKVVRDYDTKEVTNELTKECSYSYLSDKEDNQTGVCLNVAAQLHAEEEYVIASLLPKRSKNLLKEVVYKNYLTVNKGRNLDIDYEYNKSDDVSAINIKRYDVKGEEVTDTYKQKVIYGFVFQ